MLTFEDNENRIVRPVGAGLVCLNTYLNIIVGSLTVAFYVAFGADD
jgi:hypothetical protein